MTCSRQFRPTAAESQFRATLSVHRLCRNLCISFYRLSVFSLSLARATEYEFSSCFCFTFVLLISRILPFPRIGRIYGVQKLFVTWMSLSKFPRHFDEAIKNFFDSLMSHQTFTARHNQFLFSIWTSPVSFLDPKESQRTSSSFWPGERANPRSLVSHVVLKVSAERLGYSTTSSGYISGPE